MAIHLNSHISILPGFGEKACRDLKTLGIGSVQDLLYYYPFRYDDFSIRKPIGELNHGDTVTITATIQSIESRRSHKNKRLKMTEAIIGDDTGEMKVTWFNQTYLERVLKPGSQWDFAGTVDNRYGMTLMNPVHEKVGVSVSTGRMVPIYGLTGSLTMRRIREAMKVALGVLEELKDWMPQSILESEKLPSLIEAIQSVHFPESKEQLEESLKRLKFNELFLHQLLFAKVREERKTHSASQIEFDEDFAKKFVESLPFELTKAQKKSAFDILKDLEKEHPMNRLLQGDVGSGKTAVAAIASAMVLKGEKRVLYLAPTEILASQQKEAMSSFLGGGVGLLTRTMKEDTEADCLVGTHALFSQGVNLKDVGLVIIDEQHRFGVEQRHALLDHNPAPHLLSMTATPIPRSLSLTLYGDLDVSILNEKPKGRLPIGTKMVLENERSGLWSHVKEEVQKGRQAYVVCPLIDPSDKLGAKSVSEVAADLTVNDLKGLRIAQLHGKLKSDEKQKTLLAFQKGEIDVLISTTVIEVGVDVPNASIMIILGAERFGLAQLHQLRGRVGRSDIQSYCYVLPDTLSEHSRSRLEAFVGTNDGFKLAEFDLEMRGPGAMFGTAQSGMPEFKLATIFDYELMNKAREYALDLLEKDEDLAENSVLKEHIQHRLDKVHLE